MEFRLKDILRGHRTLLKILFLIPGIACYYLLNAGVIHNTHVVSICSRLTLVYLTVMAIMIANSILLGFEQAYSRSGKNKEHPLKGLVQAIQIVIFFIGGIITVAILIDKSPSALLAGLGASAAVLMLVFKDSILGFVAGVMLTRNNMIRIGDWIQMPDGSANGTVEEISLNTVKVRNWDNTISTIPPYTLISSPFKNWRGMQESAGRRVDKMIYIDVRTIKVCVDSVQNISNAQLYREYITRYIHTHPLVAQGLDIIIAQRQAGQFGLPIEVYFFLTEKSWAEFEKIQSDIFDHLIAAAWDFGLKLYQLPD
jgi:small-conductance mechanosensitive channel